MAICCWDPIDVTSSRRPFFHEGESVLYVQSRVGLYSGKHKALEYQDGVIYLTGRRICYVDSEKPALRSLSLDLERIDRIEHYAGFLKSSPKITIRYKLDSVSSSDASGVHTPQPGAGAPARQKLCADWVCPICTFTNVVPTNYVDGAALPACVNCGMKPPRNTRISSSAQSSLTDKIIPAHMDLRVASSVTESVDGPSPLTVSTFPCPRCTFGNHPAITTCELCGAPLISNNLPPVLKSNQNGDERGALLNRSSDTQSADEMSCKLSFRSAGDKRFLDRLRQAVADQAWNQIAASSESLLVKDSIAPQKKGAGIGGLQNREDMARTTGAHIMSGAFEDLEALMARAKEMMALAESFATRLSNAPLSASGTSEARSLISESSAALGLSSPVVTKDASGKAGVFHSELARQIADFLEDGKLRAEGGAMTLVDLYALYNRARNGSFISPDDLWSACQKFDDLKLPIRLRVFRSGVVVVQDRGRSDATTRQMVRTWVKGRTLGVTALDGAERFGWSVSVAAEELEMVEEYGDLARDAGVEGLKFYENQMASWDWKAWSILHADDSD